MKKTWKLDIDCPNCAAKLERALTEVPGVEAVTVNYIQKTVTLTAADDAFEAVTQAVLAKAAEVEPDATIFVEEKKTADRHALIKKTWKLDIDCPNCAAKLERALTEVPGVEAVTVNYVQKTVTLTAPGDTFEAVTQAVLAKAAEVEPDATIFVEDPHPTEEHDHEHHHEHSHEHGHEHGDGDANGRILLGRVGAAVAMLVFCLLIGRDSFVSPFVALVAYLTVGYDVLLRALRNIRRGEIFDENFLMAVASIGSMVMGEYPEAIAVMALYQIGEYFQDKAVDRSRASITQLMDIRPDYANLTDGTRVSPESVAVGQLILVKPGEKIPLDGEITEGSSSLNTTALTGESLPRDVKPGDSVLSGCVNLSGVLTIRVTAAYGESTVARILTLVEQSGESKASTERFITRFARIYTPAVCLAAVLLAVIPGLITGQWATWIHRALTFLVISCPCALIISVPLTFFSGIGGASRQGILVKGANHLETLAALDTVVFDKTGTLTRGAFSVAAVYPAHMERDALIELAALAECYSDHPISKSLKEAYGKPVDATRVSDVENLTGRGIRATVDGKVIHAGSQRLMEEIGVDAPACKDIGTIVYLAVDGAYAGCVVIADTLKPTTAQAISDLKLSGVQRLVMLTGDLKRVAEDIARRAGLNDVRAQLLPGDKVAALESLLGDNHQVAFVGDGINDAPVLRRADLGIAMGGIGSDAAIEAADVVLMDDDPLKLPHAIRIARKTLGIARQNIIFALGVKALVLVLGALGIASMWLAVFADVGVCMLAILNAMRAMRA